MTGTALPEGRGRRSFRSRQRAGWGQVGLSGVVGAFQLFCSGPAHFPVVRSSSSVAITFPLSTVLFMKLDFYLCNYTFHSVDIY